MDTASPAGNKRGAFLGIGIGVYDHFGALARAVTDVTDLGTELRAQGFTPKLISDPTSAEANDALTAWRAEYKRAKTGGAVVLFWAGHGETSVGGNFLLITKNTAAPPGSSDSVAPATLAETAALSGAEQILLVIDACYSGAGVKA